jgi:uncharacterized protein involved in outer membrane biogenesis
MGWPLDFTHGSFNVLASGPDKRIFHDLLEGFEPSALPFRLEAIGSWQDTTWRFNASGLQIGETRLVFSGTLDEPPDLSNTNLKLDFSSPDLSSLGTWKSKPLMAGPLAVKAHFSGTPTRFRMDSFQASWDDNDASGTMVVSLESGKPDITLALTSNKIDLRPFQNRDDRGSENQSSGPGDGHIIPDDPLPLDLLKKANSTFSWQIDNFHTGKQTLRNVSIKGSSNDGHLNVPELTAKALRGTIISSLSVDLEGDLALAQVDLKASGLVLNLSGLSHEDAGQLPSFDIDMDMSGTGSTLRQLAASLNGTLFVSSPGGVVPGIGSGFAPDLMLTDVISAINPLSKVDEDFHLVCLALSLEAKKGLLNTTPAITLKTNHITTWATGTLDLSNETLNINFQTVPSKAINVSASELINQFVVLTGTLAKPQISIDPTRAAISGTAAVVTGGLSLLAKAAMDRMKNTQDLCELVIAAAKKNN